MVLYGYASNEAVIAVTVAMPTLSALFTSLRIYARLAVTKNAGWDDAAISMALLASVATSVTMIAETSHGLGQHIWEVEKHQLKIYLRDFWAMIIVYNLSLTFTKISILLQYLRIFPQKPFRIAVFTVMGIVIGYATWRFFSAVFTCVPVNAFWDHSIKNKTCQDRNALSMASTSLNMTTDIIIALLPLPVLNKLQLPKRQRYALMAVFALAGLVVIISILRLPSLHILMTSKDTTYENPMAAIWSSIEINVGIICSCLPTLRCLFPKIFRSATYAMSGGSHDHSGSYNKYGQKISSSHHQQAPTGGGGLGSFGGKFSSAGTSTNVSSSYRSSITANHNNNHHKVSSFSRPLGRGDRQDRELLNSLDEIELNARELNGGSAGRRDSYGKIVVHTEIQQVESARSLRERDEASVRDAARMDQREMV